MKHVLFLLAVFLLPGAFNRVWSDTVIPQMRVVKPMVAHGGDTATVTGENLDRAHVAELYLTDGTHDVKMEITSATGTAIVFKIPAGMPAGRVNLMVLTAGENPRLIEQPVKITIQ